MCHNSQIFSCNPNYVPLFLHIIHDHAIYTQKHFSSHIIISWIVYQQFSDYFIRCLNKCSVGFWIPLVLVCDTDRVIRVTTSHKVFSEILK